jgi:multidrug resistance efflux pump
MIAILGIIYCLGAYLVFIKFRLLKFNLFWQVVVGVVGFFGLLTILYGMNYTQPFSIGSTVSGLTTQIEARVPGKVIEVFVKDNASVKKGDPLFRMDPQPYIDELHHAQASYAEAQLRTANAILQDTQTVNAANAQVQAIQAQIQATRATISAEQSDLALKKTRLKEYTELKSKNAGSEFEVEKYETDVQSATDQIAARNQQMDAQQQGLIAAQAQQVQANTALQESISIQPEVLAAAKAEVTHDQWSYDQTTAYAPDDGYVTQVTLQPGTMVSIGPVMVLVNQRSNVLLKVTVMQNYVNVVKAGELAEVAVPAMPGRILHAKVVSVEKATGSGALYPDGRLKSSYEPSPPDRMFAILHIEDEDVKGFVLPVGSSGWIAIRGENWKTVFIIRQIMMRWYTWSNYVFTGY